MRNEKLYGRVFGWDSVPEESPRPGVRRKAYVTDQVMLVMNELEPGMELRPHVHDDFDQLAYIVRGRARYYVDGTPHLMTPGTMMLVPAGSPHYIEPLDDNEEPVLNLDIFVPPRSDLLHLAAYLDAGETPEG